MKLLTEPPIDPYLYGESPIVAFELEDGATFHVELGPEFAPVTVAYFLKLVQEGFYDGLTFHRIAPGFIIQGGDPLGTGDGETDCYIKGEFAENGVDNPVQHLYGTISMARQEGCDTASCQFFITLKNAYSLDGHYAAFGRVCKGMEVVESIAAVPIDENAMPLEPVVIRRVYVEG